MKRFSEQLNIRAQSVKLRVSEKRELRERVVSYIEYHPLPAEIKVTKKPAKIHKVMPAVEPFTTFSIPFNTLFKYSTVTAVMLLLVVPFVAEKAVPGDVLYAVKVQFNEELRGTLTFDTYQKVEWETERLNRRIAEARLLASEGRLSEEAEAGVVEAVRVHSANAKRGIEELRTEDEDAANIASIALDTTLEVQSDSLRGEDDLVQGEVEEGADGRSVNLIASAIEEAMTQRNDEFASSTPPAYDKLMAKVEQNTTRIYELMGALQTISHEEELVDVTRRTEDINRAIEEAVATVEADEMTARLQLVIVLQKTQRLIVYMTELELVKTVDIETLIPVVLTQEEEEAKRTSLTKELEEKVVKIEAVVEGPEIIDEEILAKVTLAQEEIAIMFEQIRSLTLDFGEFMVLAGEATALADDMLALFENQAINTDVNTEVPTSTTTEDLILDDGVPTSTTIEETGEAERNLSPEFPVLGNS